MSGVTNSCFRRLMREENPQAIGLLVTEFISIEGLTRGNLKSRRMMEFRLEEKPISIQIFGHDIDRMVDAAKMVEDEGADIVDINSGCPVPKVVKRGGGCELMRHPLHLGSLLEKVAKAVSIPLTLKIRSGWDDNSLNAPEIARIAEESGVKMLAVHGRTRQQLYRGVSDWDIVERISRERSIPVVGSGDVNNLESAKSALKRGVAGVMIGRGAMENPWIFSDIYKGIHEDTNEGLQRYGHGFSRPYSEIIRLLFRYLELLLDDGPDSTALGRMKQLISQCTRNIPDSTVLRKELCTSRDIPTLKDRLSYWGDRLEKIPGSVYANLRMDRREQFANDQLFTS
ncbi:MAG TPA: tRNA-dihydrouridine synthase family protein [Oligoflexia bacterium]|nr:tRNA-dihydrouridine synthase family protein [Oligoflexia bacterium]